MQRGKCCVVWKRCESRRVKWEMMALPLGNTTSPESRKCVEEIDAECKSRRYVLCSVPENEGGGRGSGWGCGSELSEVEVDECGDVRPWGWRS